MKASVAPKLNECKPYKVELKANPEEGILPPSQSTTPSSTTTSQTSTPQASIQPTTNMPSEIPPMKPTRPFVGNHRSYESHSYGHPVHQVSRHNAVPHYTTSHSHFESMRHSYNPQNTLYPGLLPAASKDQNPSATSVTPGQNSDYTLDDSWRKSLESIDWGAGQTTEYTRTNPDGSTSKVSEYKVTWR